jgi:small redox-active disulfide protein 2
MLFRDRWMMKIELFSTNCVKCKRLEFNLQQALSELKMDADVIKVTDIEVMEKRGLKTVPALAIDGDIKFAGIVPPVREIRDLLNKGKVGEPA